MRFLRSLVLVASLAAMAACSPTYVAFDGPPGSVLFVNDQPHHLPSQVEFFRPAGRGDHNRYNIGLVYKLPGTGDIHATGYIDIYGFTESDVDKRVTNQCRFEEAQLTNLANGQKTVYESVTASKQPLFNLVLEKK